MTEHNCKLRNLSNINRTTTEETGVYDVIIDVYRISPLAFRTGDGFHVVRCRFRIMFDMNLLSVAVNTTVTYYDVIRANNHVVLHTCICQFVSGQCRIQFQRQAEVRKHTRSAIVFHENIAAFYVAMSNRNLAASVRVFLAVKV